MGKGRLEAFSDGVFAILITILVLEIKIPNASSWAALQSLMPMVLSYALSFVYVGIYWNNHHHMLHLLNHVNGTIMWANLHLLFWLSLLPLSTAWMGQFPGETAPVAVYAANLLLPAIAYYLLQLSIIRAQGSNSSLARAIGRDLKGKISPVLYATSLAFAFIAPVVSQILFVAVAILWLCPDRRIEKVLAEVGGKR